MTGGHMTNRKRLTGLLLAASLAVSGTISVPADSVILESPQGSVRVRSAASGEID